MGFVLTILYLITNYLTPATIFGPLAAYRVELILAVLIFLVSLHKLLQSSILKTPQFLALMGLALAVFASVLVGQRWMGGSLIAILTFIPNAFAFFLVYLHCNSKKKLEVIVLMLLFVCLYVTAKGSFDLLHGAQASATMYPNMSGADETAAIDAWNTDHPYLFVMENDDGQLFYRLRGQGLINDPNDFGQLTVCVIPLMFIFWQGKKAFRNTLFVILPVCILLVGLFLTHSRGALVALLAVAIVTVRRRIGIAPALLAAGVLFAAAMALHFTGGRGISADAGEDRTALWSEGLEVFKAHPVFGVGFGSLGDYTDEHLTAHNSVIVCAAELGIFGFYFWCMFLFSTLRDVFAVASPMKVSEGAPIEVEPTPFPQTERGIEPLDKAEINRIGRLLILSFTGFLTAGMFLSRAFVLTLFLLGGMAEVIFEMARERGMIAPRLPLGRVLGITAALMVSLLVATYFVVKILTLMR